MRSWMLAATLVLVLVSVGAAWYGMGGTEHVPGTVAAGAPSGAVARPAGAADRVPPGTRERADARPVERLAESEIEPEQTRAEMPEESLPEEIEEGDQDPARLLAHIGLPADTPVALLHGRWGPPDPVETGRASLILSLRDDASGEAVRSPVVLWRLDAPGNAYWTRGDQAIASRSVPEAGGEFRDLVAGEYRVACLAQRKGAADAPAFFVAGDAEHVLYLPMPGERPVRFVLRDKGERLTRVSARLHPIAHHPRGADTPAWVRQRSLVDPPLVWEESFNSTEGDPSMATWQTLVAGSDGFDLGAFPEDRRDRHYSRTVDLRLESGFETTVVVRNDRPGELLRIEHECAGTAR